MSQAISMSLGHLRYVGLTAAKEIYDSNLTLEEYLQENNQ